MSMSHTVGDRHQHNPRGEGPVAKGPSDGRLRLTATTGSELAPREASDAVEATGAVAAGLWCGRAAARSSSAATCSIASRTGRAYSGRVLRLYRSTSSCCDLTPNLR